MWWFHEKWPSFFTDLCGHYETGTMWRTTGHFWYPGSFTEMAITVELLWLCYYRQNYKNTLVVSVLFFSYSGQQLKCNEFYSGCYLKQTAQLEADAFFFFYTSDTIDRSWVITIVRLKSFLCGCVGRYCPVLAFVHDCQKSLVSPVIIFSLFNGCGRSLAVHIWVESQ